MSMTVTNVKRVAVSQPMPDYDAPIGLYGKRVRVYWNLHKGCYSVQAKGPKGWRVAAHVRNTRLYLSDASFIVSEAGRARVLAEGRKNVHAFVEGVLEFSPVLSGWPMLVTYNPYKAGTWVVADAPTTDLGGQPVFHSEGVTMLVRSNGRPEVVARF